MRRERLLKASVLCARSLRANLHKIDARGGRTRTVLSAGSRQFRSVWTRDFCFASGGLLLSGEDRAVRDTLDELISRQRKDGLFPRMLDSTSPFLRFAWSLAGGALRLKSPLKPNFISDHFVVSIDSNSLIAWTAARCALKTRNFAWAGLVLPALERGLDYYARLEKADGIVRQPPFSDWKDTIAARRGAVFFTELLRWKAMSSLGELLRAMGRTRSADSWKSRARGLARVLQKKFWDEKRGHFRDTLRRPRFSADGNMAAAAWGFADEDQAARILRAPDRLGLTTSWGPRASERYPLGRKGWLAVLGGAAGYQDDFVWLWTSALKLMALVRLNRLKAAGELAESLLKLLEKSGRVGEVYRPEDGREVRTWIYRSESPFSWSAGMLLEAFDALSRAAAKADAAKEPAA